MLKPETLTLITTALQGESGEDNKEIIAELTQDQADFKAQGDKVVTLETSIKDVEGLDIAKAKTALQMLEENSIKSTDDLLNLVKKGEQSDEDTAKYSKMEADFKAEKEATALNVQSQFLERDVIDSITSQYTHGNKAVATGIFKVAGADRFTQDDNGNFMGKDSTGNTYNITSKEFAESFDKEFGGMIPRPVKGSDLNHDINTDTNKQPVSSTITASMFTPKN